MCARLKEQFSSRSAKTAGQFSARVVCAGDTRRAQHILWLSRSTSGATLTQFCTDVAHRGRLGLHSRSRPSSANMASCVRHFTRGPRRSKHLSTSKGSNVVRSLAQIGNSGDSTSVRTPCSYSESSARPCCGRRAGGVVMVCVSRTAKCLVPMLGFTPRTAAVRRCI